MIKRFHEAPICYFSEVQSLTDGDYALVHLFKKDKEYYNMFDKAVKMGREVILDNSLFELREKFDPSEFAYWVQKLQPTYYIVPDVWKDCDRTIESFFDFIETVGKDLPGKIMGVAQGYSVEDTLKCYKAIEPYCDRVAINLDYSKYASETLPSYVVNNIANECELMSIGRSKLIHSLDALNLVNKSKEHHLLGCGVPQELKTYKDIDWITSVDTCSPVMYAIVKGKYPSERGVSIKPSEKMCDMMHYKYFEFIMNCIKENINQFKEYCNDR